MQKHTSPSKMIKHPRLAMVSMLLGTFVGMFSETSLNIALPKLMAAFQAGPGTVQWLVTGYMLVIGIVLPLSSLISKWFTTRQIVISGLTAFIIGAVLAACAPSFGILLLGRMIQGIGTGLILPLMFAVVMQIFPPQKIGAVMGLCALVIMFAPAIGPTLTGLILAKLSWRWIFWSFVPFLAVALLFAIFSLENVGNLSKPKPDILSICESIVGCSGLVVGASLASEKGWLSAPVLTSLIIGIVVLALYAHRQLHLDTPILNLHIFKNGQFTSGAAVVMLDFGIILSAMYLLPIFIQKGLGLPVALTGMIMLPGGVVNAIVSAIAGRMYDNLGAKIPAVSGLIIALVGAIMLIMASSHAAIGYVIAAHIILMIGCPLAMSPSQSGALNSLTPAQSGDGSTILNTAQQLVGALATALATSLLEMGRHGSSSAVSYTSGFHTGMWLTIIFIIVGLILAIRMQGRNDR